jgi:methanogenic corrinoid protein MtbC1
MPIKEVAIQIKTHLSETLEQLQAKFFKSPSSNKLDKQDWQECLPDNSATPSSQGMPIHAGPQEHINWLVGTIESNIIPRLIASHPNSGSQQQAKQALSQSIENPEKVQELVDLILQDASQAEQRITDYCAAGIPLEEIYLRLISPSAKRLGEMWDEDTCSFVDVTIGLWRMKQIMHDLSPVFQEYSRTSQYSPKAMLIPMTGSQHTLGLFMVSEFFRKAGWKVWGELSAQQPEVVTKAANEWFDLIGISVSIQEQFTELNNFIQTLKNASKNPEVGIMVGGPLFIANPELISQVQADIIGLNAQEAIEAAELLIIKVQEKNPISTNPSN